MKRSKHTKLEKGAAFAVGFAAALAAFAGADQWNDANNPSNVLGDVYITHYSDNPASDGSDLPLRGWVASAPWSGSYLPNSTAGLNVTGNDPNANPYNVTMPTMDDLYAMSDDDIAKLPSSIKLCIIRDKIVNGSYDCPYVKSEYDRVSKDPWNTWAGLCNGWTAAAINYVEPQPTVLTNNEGIDIPLSTADIEAFMTYYYGVEQAKNLSIQMIGSRCVAINDPKVYDFEPTDENPYDRTARRVAACADTQAAAFHLMLTNSIGIQQRAFIADIDYTPAVWNQPIVGYSTQKIHDYTGDQMNPAKSPGTVRQVELYTTMNYAVSLPPEQTQQPLGQPQLGTRAYHYILDLDNGDNVIGGYWLDRMRPDFLWTVAPISFTGDFAFLSQITTPVQTNAYTPSSMVTASMSSTAQNNNQTNAATGLEPLPGADIDNESDLDNSALPSASPSGVTTYSIDPNGGDASSGAGDSSN